MNSFIPKLRPFHSLRAAVKTRFLILSDTHACHFPIPQQQADVAIHCGDLTEHSNLAEFRTSLALLKALKAPLKLVIAGNHDFTLDPPVFRKKVFENKKYLTPSEIIHKYGDIGEALHMMKEARESGVIYMNEGTHHFTLKNGATLKVYASPFVPCYTEWGFRYSPKDGHSFDIQEGTDLVITHAPPKGVLNPNGQEDLIGCPRILEATAKARPRMHCFGHFHEGWGARLVAWREKTAGLSPIDEYHSVLIQHLDHLRGTMYDDFQTAQGKRLRAEALYRDGFYGTSHCEGDEYPLTPRKETLFVNAAIKGNSVNLPWIADIELRRDEQ